jgi:hypothetical protein
MQGANRSMQQERDFFHPCFAGFHGRFPDRLSKVRMCLPQGVCSVSSENLRLRFLRAKQIAKTGFVPPCRSRGRAAVQNRRRLHLQALAILPAGSGAIAPFLFKFPQPRSYFMKVIRNVLVLSAMAAALGATLPVMAQQEGMSGMAGQPGMSGMAGQEGMSGMSGMAGQEGMSGMSGEKAKKTTKKATKHHKKAAKEAEPEGMAGQ